MYADTAHFVYELLQNADDAGASLIHFTVTEDALTVEHNGSRAFSENDVRAISYFGEGKTDLTKIGHFGLGFKSVFAYTATPHIYSGHESFLIRDLYTLAPTPAPPELQRERTRFVLPFDHEAVRPIYVEASKLKSESAAAAEITEKLRTLGGETLLFTNALCEIRWERGNAHGHYLLDEHSIAENFRELYIL